jgi:hypothetical protein
MEKKVDVCCRLVGHGMMEWSRDILEELRVANFLVRSYTGPGRKYKNEDNTDKWRKRYYDSNICSFLFVYASI